MALTFVPGFMLDQDLWTDILPALGGFGPFTHADPHSATSIEDMARQTLLVSAAKFDLIGFSMGGYVAREMVRMAPDRVSRLILIATSSRGDNELQARRRVVAAEAGLATFRGVSRRSIAQSLAASREGDEALIARVHAMSLRLGGDSFRKQAGFYRAGDTAQLDRITCPTLVVAGEQDRLRSMAEARELAHGIPNARFASLPAGHMLPLEMPDELAQLLREFLSSPL
ncbi:alpha/beta fold hydrolase [Paracoccus aestuariivivens]|uniref:Alpha/beta fold hydrolase n=1 Tax=Paracoccus aestuariivivens TaxID=1820333 RepID=A0A6L6J4P3_9RHOB|nr:alpha/beta hydrolase [Paracoccus aestuariivivens]MTH76195.1 alpha/beta fold hydrolase [Paracoccus aestuariivivens]